MHIFKIGTFATILSMAALVGSCDFEMPVVSRTALESSMEETQQAGEALRSVQESYTKQNKDLTSILQQLSELSYQTTTLQLKTENGVPQVTQVEQINKQLAVVKKRIDNLEKEAARVRRMDKEMALSVQTIKELRATVSVQQEEINRLRCLVTEKDNTIESQTRVIHGQRDTISVQMKTISRQKNDLKKAFDAQTELIYTAGCDFEKLGDDCDEVLNVTGRRDRAKVTEYRKIVYGKALEMFRQAAKQDFPGAQTRVEVVTYKMSQL